MSGILPPSLHTDNFYYKYYQNKLHSLIKINFINLYIFEHLYEKFSKSACMFIENMHALHIPSIIRSFRPYLLLLYKH